MAVAREVLAEYPPCPTCGFVDRLEVIQFGPGSYDDPKILAHENAARSHLAHTTREFLATTPLEVIRQQFDVAPIRKQFGSWAVTVYGLESLANTIYQIPKSRVFSDWERHMSEKVWVLMEDFSPALRAARIRYRGDVSPSVRFAVLQRDNFRCRLCGHSADDGVTVLEIDHRVPVARGGKSKPENLWTLCFECNRGKATRLIGPL